MHTIQLTASETAPIDDLVGQYLGPSHYDRVVRDTCTVLKPDGTPLLIYVKDALPRSACLAAFNGFKDVPLRSDNRGVASGSPRFRKGRNSQAEPVPSDVLGFVDRTSRMPYCRMTALTLENPDALSAALPLAAAASRLFKELAPDRWEAQQTFVGRVSPAFVIPGTAFTTITVNRNWRTAAHRDAGDYRPGMGVMAVLDGGHYEGSELVFPRFKTAVDMRTGGICCADVHELHGNAPLTGWPGRYVRLSFVFYARERMQKCGTPAEEREHAEQSQERRSGRMG